MQTLRSCGEKKEKLFPKRKLTAGNLFITMNNQISNINQKELMTKDLQYLTILFTSVPYTLNAAQSNQI